MINHYPTMPSEADRLFLAHQNEPAYCPDLASEIDTPEETLADLLGITPQTATRVLEYTAAEVRRSQSLVLGRLVGLLFETTNLPVLIHAIAFAAGLDQLNGAKSQAQVAKELGVTRALLSHYVVAVRDALSGRAASFDCLKFRKRQSARATFANRATDPFTAAKAAAIRKQRTTTNNHATTTAN